MTTSSVPDAGTTRKSTTDRSVSIQMRALRLWFALESRIAPNSAERRAAKMFATPPRQKKTIAAPSAYDRSNHSAIDLQISHGDLRISASAIGAGPIAMLIHGWGGTANDMLPAAIALAKSGWRAVVFDMPGHGKSPGKDSSLVHFMRAIRAVWTALGAPHVIVAHSMGGAAAALGIVELGLPARRAILIAPAPGPAYYVDRFVRSVGLPVERTDGIVRNLTRRVGRPMESLDAVVAAQSADVPALIFHDPADRYVPFEYAERIRDAWRGSRLVPTPRLGHKGILRDSTTLASIVEFVEPVRLSAHSPAP